MRNIYSEDAFTGLEAAIVLIAFVVVAAVFSYVVLGAGFFTTQTAQATVHTGVGQASSSLELVGNVYGIQDGSNQYLKYSNITVALTAGGTAMDLSQMVVSYNDGTTRNASMMFDTSAACTNSMGGTATTRVQWCIAQKLNANANNLLEPNEQFIIAVGMPTSTTPNTKFTINFQPAVGAALPITRSIPGAVNPIQPLY
jgi:flagellin FlaB